MDTKYTTNFLKLSREDQKATLEVLFFATEEPLTSKKLNRMLLFNNMNCKMNDNGNEIDDEINESGLFQKLNISSNYIQELVDEINQELIATNRPFHIIRYANGWQYATRPEYGELVHSIIKSNNKRKLSQPALETLAIIAYKQPITKPEIDSIRGVNSTEILNSLIEKKLIKIAGRKEVIGRPLLYTTTDNFLKLFGLNSLNELPNISELNELQNENNPHEKVKQEILLLDVNQSHNEENHSNAFIHNNGDSMANYEEEIFDDEYQDESFDSIIDDESDDDDFDSIPDELIDDSFENYGEEGDEESIV